MKKIIRTTTGIYVFTALPFFITIVTFFCVDIFQIIDNIKRILMNPIYKILIIPLSLSIIIFIVLMFRKLILDKSDEIESKIKSLSMDAENRTDNIFAIMMFWQSKTREQFQEFYFSLTDKQKKYLPKTIKITEAEKMLFKRLEEYESAKGDEIISLFAKGYDSYKEKESDDNSKTD